MNKRQLKKFDKKFKCKTYSRSKLKSEFMNDKVIALSKFKKYFSECYDQMILKRYHDILRNDVITEKMKNFTLKELEKLKYTNNDESTATFQSQMFRPALFDFAKSDKISNERDFSVQLKMYSDSASLRKQLIIDNIKNRGNDEL